MSLTEGEKTCFEKIEEDYQKLKEGLATKAGIVHDFGDSRSARVPWLESTGFPFHLKDLLDAEIYSSYKLPSDRELEEGGIRDPVLVRIIMLPSLSCMRHTSCPAIPHLTEK